METFGRESGQPVSSATMHGTPLELIPARDADVHGIWRLRRQLEDWLAERSVNQWPVGHMTEDVIRDQVRDGLWHVAHRRPTDQQSSHTDHLTYQGDDGAVVAALRIQVNDPDFWPENPPDSLFVHGLMVDRSLAGQRMGERMLRWAAQQARERGASWLRLDCAADNQALRDYYRCAGFEEVREQEVDGLFTVTLMQKAL